jgi:hypothetical protein
MYWIPYTVAAAWRRATGRSAGGGMYYIFGVIQGGTGIQKTDIGPFFFLATFSVNQPTVDSVGTFHIWQSPYFYSPEVAKSKFHRRSS